MTKIAPPLGLLAELTHRCPLACLYCSNPLELRTSEQELSTSEWISVLDSAKRSGIVQVHFSGGEPLLRPDLEILIEHATSLGFYVNLITSGVGLTASRTRALARSGVNNIQLSLQSTDNSAAKAICAKASLESKMEAASHIAHAEIPLCWNIVLHRLNIEDITEMVQLCATYKPHRIELAHVQYHGRALASRHFLLPELLDIEIAENELQRIRSQYRDQFEIIYVKPDWYEKFPKPCNGGWARLQIIVEPGGLALPCTSAASIKHLQFPNVRDFDLSSIWYQSEAFNAFRGFEWMSEPCRSCEYRERDFGGCRCQAFALTGDASRTDPACSFSPDREMLSDIMATATK